jgi:hypothetical protein
MCRPTSVIWANGLETDWFALRETFTLPLVLV